MKKSTKAAAIVAASEAKGAQAAQVPTTKVSATYAERMQINKDACTKSPKIAYKAIRDYSAIPSDLLALAVDSVAFSSFVQYMKDRHGIAQEDKTISPKKGWSIWFALQWAEKQVKAAADDPTHAAHKKAVEYLRKNRAELQDVANKAIF